MSSRCFVSSLLMVTLLIFLNFQSSTDSMELDFLNEEWYSSEDEMDSTPCDFEGRLQVSWNLNKLSTDSELIGEISICGFDPEMLLIPNNYSLEYTMMISGQPILMEKVNPSGILQFSITNISEENLVSLVAAPIFSKNITALSEHNNSDNGPGGYLTEDGQVAPLAPSLPPRQFFTCQPYNQSGGMMYDFVSIAGSPFGPAFVSATNHPCMSVPLYADHFSFATWFYALNPQSAFCASQSTNISISENSNIGQAGGRTYDNIVFSRVAQAVNDPYGQCFGVPSVNSSIGTPVYTSSSKPTGIPDYSNTTFGTWTMVMVLMMTLTIARSHLLIYFPI